MGCGHQDAGMQRAQTDDTVLSRFRQALDQVLAAWPACHTAFHTAEALIVEKTGRVAKTHACGRASRQRWPVAASPSTTVLAQSYEFKDASDYSIDPDVGITMADAEEVIRSAAEMVRVAEASLR
jgi:uncharacterized protein (UPF0332 family)